ncbi:MAG: hypothetical protein AB7S81_00440 [Bdellovibrionales bacterium]
MHESKTTTISCYDTDNSPAVIGYMISSLFGAAVGFVIGLLC